ncbi:unnamed protein product [Peniophora sp. CBMAI 1063]|nr:unnamed protein product [Peniophora sp. CBMAI 1063]
MSPSRIGAQDVLGQVVASNSQDTACNLELHHCVQHLVHKIRLKFRFNQRYVPLSCHSWCGSRGSIGRLHIATHRSQTLAPSQTENMDMEDTDGASIAHDLFMIYVLQVVPITVLYYDYLLTIRDEIENYWPTHRPLSWLSGLFLGTRYLTLLGFAPVLAAVLWGRESVSRLTNAFLRCGFIVYYHPSLEIFLQIPVAVLCILRVYALYAQDRRVLVGLVLLFTGLLAVGLALFSTVDAHPTLYYWPVAPLCGTSTNLHDGVRLAIGWSTLLVFDMVIFLLTAVRAFKVWKAGRIVHVVLRDGVMYFCALSVCNLVNIVILVVSTPLLRTAFASLTNVLSVTLISRLMLNLRSDTRSTPLVGVDDTELSVTPAADLDSDIAVSEANVGTHQSAVAAAPSAHADA